MSIPKLSKNPASSFVLVFLIFAFSLTFFVSNLEARAGDVSQRYALVVGITEYQHEDLNNPRFPAKDAKAFYDLLVKKTGFNEEDMTLLINEDATRERFDEELSKLVTETSEDDFVVIYYSGLGTQGPDYNADERDGRDEYYVTYDTDPSSGEQLYKTAYSDDEFANKVKSISTDQIAIFLETSYAGGADIYGENNVLVAASSENQPSWESPELDQGVFTYFLLEGLKGKADKDEDDTITIEELRSYIAPNVEEFTEENFSTKQTPLVKGELEVPVIREGGNKASLVVNLSESSGSDLDGEVYLDGTYKGSTARDGKYKIEGLSSGSYTVKASKDGYSINSVTVYLSEGEQEEITLTLEKKNKLPEVKGFSIEPHIPEVGEEITVDGSESTDPDGSIKNYSWDFGGGVRKEGKKVSDLYHWAGTHEITLTITDDDGATSSLTREIEVLPEQREPLKVNDKYALLIGISEYEDESLDLEYGKKDAEAFKEILLDSGIGGFKENNITTLTNEAATKEGIEKALTNLAKRAGRGDLVVIYYSGHGAQGEDYDGDEQDGYDEYLIPYDVDMTDDKSIYNTAYRDDHLGENLEVMRSQGQTILLFLDTKGFESSNSLSQSGSNTGSIIMLAAARECQCPYESQSLKQGVFTHYLFEALEGKADKDDDGKVSLKEVYNYVKPRQEEFTKDNYDKEITPIIKGIMTDREVTFPSAVKNKSPKSSFSYSPANPGTDQKINFNSDSSDPDGSIESYQWDLTGDGTYEKSGSEVTHTYEKEGDYEVELKVTDNHGDSDTTTQKITVSKKEDVQVGQKYALIIGISEYKNVTQRTCQYRRFCQLSFAEKDAERFYELMRNEEIGKVPKENITLLLGEEATQKKIKAAFGELIDKTSKNDLVVFYYSGHGAQGEDYGDPDEKDGKDEFYLPYDTDIDDLFGTAIRDDEFADWMKSLSEQYVAIFLDSCYSGGATKAVKGVGEPTKGQEVSVFDDLSYDSDNRALLAASEEGQQALEPQDLKQGLFTHYLVEGLTDKSADSNDDGNLTVEEIYDYIRPKIQEYAASNDHEQVPIKKGTLIPALVAKEQQAEEKGKATVKEGTVVGMAENKDVATTGDLVSVDLGKKQGVGLGDSFKAVKEYSSSVKGVTIVEQKATLEVVELQGTDRALCEVQDAVTPIEIGDPVRLVEDKEDR